LGIRPVADFETLNYQIMTDLNTSTEATITDKHAIGFIPCYRLPFLSLFHADCMEIMKQYPDKYFDLAIVDPPYSETFNTNACADNKGKKGNYNISTLNGHLPTDEYWIELKRVSKHQIIWGANWYGKYFGVGGVCWFKDNTGNYSPCEYAFQSINNHVHYFKWTWNGMIQQNMKDKQIRIHPTEKPKQVYEFLIKEFAKPDFKILDTHFGSGSIALAVDKANRLDKMNLHLTACEIDKEYIYKAIKRISESIKQGTLSF
jgi:site-specific DNA-methyltransferase (adenine-specific)